MRLLGGLAITVMTLYCAPRGRRGKGRSIEGSGLYPELAAYRISEGSSPNLLRGVRLCSWFRTLLRGVTLLRGASCVVSDFVLGFEHST
jgi:hypothetical protein